MNKDYVCIADEFKVCARILLIQNIKTTDIFIGKIMLRGNHHRNISVQILTHISLASFLWDIGKQNSPRCDAEKRGVPSGAILFAYMIFIEK